MWVTRHMTFLLSIVEAAIIHAKTPTKDFLLEKSRDYVETHNRNCTKNTSSPASPETTPAVRQSALSIVPRDEPPRLYTRQSRPRAKLPADDDLTFQYLRGLCTSHMEYQHGWLIRYDWHHMYCEGNTVVITCQAILSDRKARITKECLAHEKCVEREHYINPQGEVVKTAACVPDYWKYVVNGIQHGTRWAAAMCGKASGLHPYQALSSSQLDLTVHVSHAGIRDPTTYTDIKAKYIFIWDITNQNDPVLLNSAEDTARASVPVKLEQGKNKDFKMCVTVPYYWQLRENEVVIDWMHSAQYAQIKAHPS